MKNTEKAMTESEKFLVLGYVGDVVSSETTDSVVVRAKNLEEALEGSSRNPGFTPVSGLRESELREMLKKIESHRD